MRYLFCLFLFITASASGQVHIALKNLQRATIVEGTKAGQIALTDADGIQRYAQYVEINPTVIGYTPTATGNVLNLSEFVTTATGDVWYIDWQGRGKQIGGGSSSSCDLDWLKISNNGCPTAITDSLYKKKYVSIGGRLVWPSAELLVLDSTGTALEVIAGDRTAALGLWDLTNGKYSRLDQSGTSTTLITQGPFVLKNATGGTIQSPAGLSTQMVVDPAAATVKFNDYASTRATDVSSLDRIFYPDANGVVQVRPVGDLPGGTITKSALGDTIILGSSKVSDNYDPRNTPFQLRTNLLYTDPALYNVKSSTGTMSVMMLGDSYIEQQLFPGEFRQLLQSQMVLAGPGFVQAGDIFRPANTAASPNSLSANGWTLRTMSTGTTGKSLSLYSVVSTVSSTSFYWLPQSKKNTSDIWNTVEVWYYGQPSGGSITIQVDSITVGTINTALLSGFQRTTYTIATNKQHSLKVVPVTAGAEILGFNCYTAATYGVRFNSIGQIGAKPSHYLAADTSIWNKEFRALNPNIVFINLGTNNRAASQTLVAFKAEMKLLVQFIRRAKRTTDICLVGQVDVISTFGTPIASAEAFNNVLRQICIEDTCAYFNSGNIFGSYLFSSTNGLMSVDGIHPAQKGGYVLATELAKGFIPFNGYNIRDGFLNNYGALAPMISTGNTANRIPYYDKTGAATTSAYLTIDTLGISPTFAGNVNVGTMLYATAAKVGTNSSSGVFVAGGNSVINNFGFANGTDCISAGFSGGVRTETASYGPITFQNTNQGSVIDMFAIAGFHPSADKQMPNANSSVLNIRAIVGSMNNSTIENILHVSSPLNQATAIINTKLVGVNVALKPTSLNGVELVGFADSIGNNYLNYVSGNTGIGLAMLANSPAPTAKLQIGAGSMTVPPLAFTTGGSLLSTKINFAFEANSSVLTETNGAGLRYSKGGKVLVITDDAGNTGTSATVLSTYTLPANGLNVIGQEVSGVYAGIFADATATVGLSLSFGGTLIAATGTVATTVSNWSIRYTILRTGASTARATVDILAPGLALPFQTTYTEITGLDFTTTNALGLSAIAAGAGGGTNDIVLKLGSASWMPQSQN